jgi:predicted RNA-binding protein with PUA-like domain
MSYWLFKEEPDHYGFTDLQRDGQTVWDGVSNNLARKHLRAVRKGDRVFFYHTGTVKAIIGEMVVLCGPEAEADDPQVTVKAVRALARPVLLKEIKDDPELEEWDLVRLPRLSVLPVTEAQWRRVEELGRRSD